jgi:hypothetical protein
VSADFHDLFDQVFDGPIFALFPRQTFAQRGDDRLRDGFAATLGQVPWQLVGFRVFDAKWHGYAPSSLLKNLEIEALLSLEGRWFWLYIRLFEALFMI